MSEYYSKSISPEDVTYFAKKVIEEMLVNNNILNREQTLNEKQYVVFYLLHEEGHYDYHKKYFRLGDDVETEKYLNKYAEQKKVWEQKYPNVEKYSSLDAQRDYREIEQEKYADNYAVRRLKDEDVKKLFHAT